MNQVNEGKKGREGGNGIGYCIAEMGMQLKS